MIAYKFSVSNDGTLICYKSDKTLTKYTGENAKSKLKHIRDFSFYTFETNTKKIDTNKVIHNLRFISNNHIVVYEDIRKFQRKNTSIVIEDELRDILNIVKENNTRKNKQQLLAQRIKEEKKKKLLLSLKSTKTRLAAIQTAGVIGLTSLFSFGNTTNKLNDENKDIKHITTLSDNVNDEIITAVESNLKDIKEGVISDAQIAEANKLALEELQEEQTEIEKETIPEEELLLIENVENYDGVTLNSYDGIVTSGPSGGKETYYDADCISKYGMDKVVEYMRDLGYNEEDYPYYIREDGVRMFGRYVMVAANVDIYPKGTLVETSLGVGIVCDACEAADENIYQLDIAVNWTKKLWK